MRKNDPVYLGDKIVTNKHFKPIMADKEAFDLKEEHSLEDFSIKENEICQSFLKIMNKKSIIDYNPNRVILSFEHIFSDMSTINNGDEYRFFMSELSKKFPDILFTIYCQHSASIDIRVEFFLNGKYQKEEVELHHDSFNIDKLEEIKATEEN